MDIDRRMVVAGSADENKQTGEMERPSCMVQQNVTQHPQQNGNGKAANNHFKLSFLVFRFGWLVGCNCSTNYELLF